MMDRIDRHDPEQGEDFCGAGPDAPRGQDGFASMIERMLLQCSALLHQQLERKAKQEPMVYDQGRIDHVMREFEAASADIRATIASRVRTRVSQYVQQEILRVLEDALSDGAKELEYPVWSDRGHWTPPAINEEASRQPKERRPAMEEDSSLLNLGRGAEEPPTVREAPRVERRAEPPTPPRVQRQKRAAEVHEPDPWAAHLSEPEEYDDQASSADGVSEEPLQTSADGVYEGTVKLSVEPSEGAGQVVHFVEGLRRKPDFHLLRLVGNHREGVGIWLVLRAPLRLKEALLQIEGVSAVEAPRQAGANGHEPRLNVRLAGNPSLN